MKEHRLEKRARMLAEAMVHRTELVKRALQEGARYAFTTPLTEYEQYQRYTDPMMRLQIEESILRDEGQAGLDKYREHMAKVMEHASQMGVMPNGGA